MTSDNDKQSFLQIHIFTEISVVLSSYFIKVEQKRKMYRASQQNYSMFDQILKNNDNMTKAMRR